MEIIDCKENTQLHKYPFENILNLRLICIQFRVKKNGIEEIMMVQCERDSYQSSQAHVKPQDTMVKQRISPYKFSCDVQTYTSYPKQINVKMN